jgi:DNA modification methylase
MSAFQPFAELDLPAIFSASARAEIIGDALLIQGDCREILPLLSGLAAIVCDPAYKLTAGGNGKASGGMSGGWLDDYDNKGAPVIVNTDWPELTPLLFAALGPDADCYLMTNDKNLQACLNSLTLAGFKIHNILVWDKRTATANRWYMKNCEFVVYAWKGKAKMINFPGSRQLISMPQIDETDHPTEKPAALMSHLIGNSSERGGLVCDPQMGSGTTGVSAIQLSRRFVGIELEAKFYDYALERITRAEPNGNFFDKTPAKESHAGFAL